MSENSTIEVLKVDGNKLGDEGAIALSKLTSLRSLTAKRSRIGPKGAAAFSNLKKLNQLDLAVNGVGDVGAEAISKLPNLVELNLESNGIGDRGARALGVLEGLTSLSIAANRVSSEGFWELRSLKNLKRLNAFSNDIGDDGAAAIAFMPELISLKLGGCQLGDEGAKVISRLRTLSVLHLEGNNIGESGAQALGELVGLDTLFLDGNQIGDLGARAISQISSLNKLYLAGANIGDEGLKHISKLSGLTTLVLSGNSVTEGNLISPLSKLRFLDLRHNKVVDLSFVRSLTNLRELVVVNRFEDSESIVGFQNSEDFKDVWFRPKFRRLVLHNIDLPGVPEDVLSSQKLESCLKNLRAHFSDLENGYERLNDLKCFLLGNGRIGKTQIARRLRGDDFDPGYTSTHGIQINNASLFVQGHECDANLRIWDFGGQDLYHSTHALFLRSQAVFIVVWTPRREPENEPVHEHENTKYRNFPLSYWLAHLRFQSGLNSSPLIIQSLWREDGEAEDRIAKPPALDELLYGFSTRCLPMAYNARDDRPRAMLNASLEEAITHLWQRDGVPLIGHGRIAVRDRLRELFDDDQQRPPRERLHRVIPLSLFERVCAEVRSEGKIVTSEEALLDALHRSGEIYYQPQFFGSNLVLDQEWLLDTVYAIFDRTGGKHSNYARILSQRGRFSRTELRDSIWANHGIHVANSAHVGDFSFLKLMLESGICFELGKRSVRSGEEVEYIAPDLLPTKNDPSISESLSNQLRNSLPENTVARVLRYEFLSPSLIRSLMSRIGRKAGKSATYWKDGICFFDNAHKATAIVEQSVDETDWSGLIEVKTFGVDPAELSRKAIRLLILQEEDLGMRHREDPEIGLIETNSEPEPEFEFGEAPVGFFVSYRREDAGGLADTICRSAADAGVKIERDVDVVGMGDSISDFSRRLANGEKVVFILSRGFFRSFYCVYELMLLWYNCRRDMEEFSQRAFFFLAADADDSRVSIRTTEDREVIRGFWDRQEKDLRERDHRGIEYEAARDASHEIGRVLEGLQDKLRSEEFTDFVDHVMRSIFR